MAEKKTKLADNKTKPTTASVEDFLNNIDNEQKRKGFVYHAGRLAT
jgi:hypothetical protein